MTGGYVTGPDGADSVPVRVQIGPETVIPAAVVAAMGTPPAFECPRCGIPSWNPNDAREGYCSACHDWTGPGT